MNLFHVPKQVVLSVDSPVSDFVVIEDHIAGAIPLTISVLGDAGLSDEWLQRVRRSPHIHVAHPQPAVSAEHSLSAEITRWEPALVRMRVAVLAIGVVISATAAAMLTAFGLGI